MKENKLNVSQCKGDTKQFLAAYYVRITIDNKTNQNDKLIKSEYKI